MSVCKWCQAPVLWREHHRTRKPAPIDPQPTPDGNIRLAGNEYAVLHEPDLEEARRDGERLHLNHWATCPDAPPRRPAKATP